MKILNILGEHLSNIWVLAGLVLVLFTGLLKLLPIKTLTSTATERLMHKGINFLFILGLVSIVLGFVQNIKQELPVVKTDAEAIEKTRRIEQKIENNSGTAANSLGDAHLHSPPPTTQDRTPTKHSTPIDQQIKGNSGVAINAGGDVSINIPEK